MSTSEPVPGIAEAVPVVHEPNPFARRITTTLKNLSYSSLTAYLKCPFQWYNNYVLKKWGLPFEALVFGGAVHKTWTDYQVLSLRGESRINLQTLWHRSFDKEVKMRTKKAGGINWGKGSMEETYAEGVKLFDTRDMSVDFVPGGNWDNRHTQEFPHIRAFMDVFPTVMTKSKYDLTLSEDPTKGHPGVERFVEMQLPGVPKKLLGFLDWIGAGGVPHDLKTSGRSWYAGSVDSEIQPNLYLAMLLAKAPHVIHPDLIFKHVIIIRNKKHKAQVVSSKRTPGQIMWALRLVKRIWGDMAAGRIAPNPEFEWCGTRCNFWDKCLGNEGYRDPELADILDFQGLIERRESYD